MTKDIQLYRPTVDLMKASSQKEIELMAGKVMRFAPGGNRLNKEQAITLSVYAWMTDANIFNGEAYWTDTGPQLGIPLYRRKAKEYNRVMGGDEDWDYKVNFRLAEPHEGDFDPDKGDVAWVCELTDTKAEKEWQNTYVRFFNMLIEAGAPYKEADQRALHMAGPRPVWSSVGVVSHKEHFSAIDYEDWKTKTPKTDEDGEIERKPEMWDRNERAKKRAEKGALKKRYPDLIIPAFYESYDDNVSKTIVEVSKRVDDAEENRKEKIKNLNPDDILAELGYDIEDGQYKDVPPPEEPPHDPLWDTDAHGDEMSGEVLPVVAQKVEKLARERYDKRHTANQKQRGLLRMLLETTFGEYRGAVCAALTNGRTSTSANKGDDSIPDHFVLALLDWLSAEKTDDGYVISGDVMDIAPRLRDEVIKAQGKKTLGI